MKIKEAKYKKQKKLINVRVSDDVYGCDYCEAIIDMNKPDTDYLRATIHHHEKGAEDLHYCSWGCFGKDIVTKKSEYFISLPFLNFDLKKKGLRAKDFFDILK